jgi:hypothetical protein
MTPNDPDPTPELRAGRRALESVAGCRLLEDFHRLGALWALRLRLEPPGLVPTEFIPASTDWFLLAGPAYLFERAGSAPTPPRNPSGAMISIRSPGFLQPGSAGTCTGPWIGSLRLRRKS